MAVSLKSKRRGRPPIVIEQIRDRLENEVVRALSPQARLPSERDLCALFGVSRPTIRAALSALAKAGKIVLASGRGAYVSNYTKVRHSLLSAKELAVSFADVQNALRNSFNTEVLNGVLTSIKEAEMNLMIPSYPWKWLKGPQPADFLNNPNVLGVCLLGRHRESEIRSILGLGKPTVAVDFDGRAYGLDSICFDNRRAGDLLARRLHLLGHRRILAVFEDRQKPEEKRDEAWTLRMEGFLDAWRKTGAPEPTIRWLQQRGEMDSFSNVLEPLLHNPTVERPTALVLPIMPSMDAVRVTAARLGLEVPRQLTVVAFGHCSADERISGIRFNGFSLGETAVKTVINAMFNQRRGEGKPKLIRIPGRFVAGESHARNADGP